MLTLAPAATPTLRGRIGRDARSGHYAVPRRYRLHVSLACPDGLRIAVTHGLLGLADALPLVRLPVLPDLPDGGYTALAPLYEASSHRHPGPAAPPVLSDAWTGRIVSTHPADILGDLAGPLRTGGPSLRPAGPGERVRAIEGLCRTVEDGLPGTGDPAGSPVRLRAALGDLEAALGGHRHLFGEAVSALDVRLWVALRRLDLLHRPFLDAATLSGLTALETLWAYARRLSSLPAFEAASDPEGMARLHPARRPDRARTDPGPLLDWTAPTGL